MLIIGLSGGVACGKSLVAQCFCELGCEIINADHIGHEVLKQQQVVAQIQRRFGDQVIRGGKVDRRKLAEIVFSAGGEPSSEALLDLERITHPPIGRAIEQRLEHHRSRAVKAVVLDAPVMFKVGWDKFCDRIVFVEADVEVRKQRALSRGWAETELERRESQQMPLEMKRQRSTHFVTNSASVEALKNQVRQLWRQWNRLT